MMAIFTLSGCAQIKELKDGNSTKTFGTNEPMTMTTLFDSTGQSFNEYNITDHKDEILSELAKENEHQRNIDLLNGIIDINELHNDIIRFNYDSSSLSESAKITIQKHSESLKVVPEIKVILEGHTDSIGDRSYNLKLGERRALAVKDYAIELGVNPNQIEVISYGEEKLLNNESSEDQRMLNRRAVFIYK